MLISTILRRHIETDVQMGISIFPLHKHKQYLSECCKLINDEWKRSETARLHSLESSCDSLPTSLVLVEDGRVIGHLKLTPIPSIKDACFVESVVIARHLRGQGYGRILMRGAEDHCRTALQLRTVYLSTKGQEGFYAKLGYVLCKPVSIYGCFVPETKKEEPKRVVVQSLNVDAPVPPPLPHCERLVSRKVFMKKELISR
ncbi:unnamed protein product [Acanthoscelides obtectus]|uniref:N-acetyltransferase domain-containing protein n=1 Tax=Acanthoscelides obtectus TaxID=200917 RepID=A0A9P0K608_ACAOB|nr:unnamed protein product [Acanthoscelides obtectus]CAK1676749.1 N-acetyltransferase 6 [Acanthoscelides obtectus]